MNRPTMCIAAVLGFAVGLAACDFPECIDGPSNLTPESTAACAAPPEGSSPETEITNAGAELRDDGTLVLTLSSMGLECGTEASDIPPPEDCAMDAWVFTLEIPPELVAVGVLELSDYPEILGSSTVISGLDGGSSGSIGDEPYFVGQVELTDINDGCVTGVVHGFGTGSFDSNLGGPELDGSFVAPRC
jgi:hypothetical protein